MGVLLAGVLLAGALASAGCAPIPADDTLVVEGTLERDGVAETDLASVAVNYASASARGEWWSCELRLTAGGCIGDHHVNVWLSLPGITDFDGLGQAGCADAEGNAYGVYELLREKTDVGDPIALGEDVNALVLVASDLDGNRAADLASDDETTAASLLLDGSVTVQGIGSFEDPIAVTVDGTTGDGNSVRIEGSGPTAPQPNPPPFDQARTCVSGDLLEG